MKFSRSLLLLPVALVALSGKVANAQTRYNFTFDNTFDNTMSAPIVGTGVFTFTNDLGLGTFAYNDLGPVTFSFTIAGETFTEADIVTDNSKTTVVITAYSGGGRRLQFSDTGFGAGVGAGPRRRGGSLDAINANDLRLSFEPSFFGEGLNRYGTSFSSDGSYLAVSAPTLAPVPEPGEYAVMGMAGMCLCGLMIRAKRRRDGGTRMGLTT